MARRRTIHCPPISLPGTSKPFGHYQNLYSHRYHPSCSRVDRELRTDPKFLVGRELITETGGANLLPLKDFNNAPTGGNVGPEEVIDHVPSYKDMLNDRARWAGCCVIEPNWLSKIPSSNLFIEPKDILFCWISGQVWALARNKSSVAFWQKIDQHYRCAGCYSCRTYPILRPKRRTACGPAGFTSISATHEQIEWFPVESNAVCYAIWLTGQF